MIGVDVSNSFIKNYDQQNLFRQVATSEFDYEENSFAEVKVANNEHTLHFWIRKVIDVYRNCDDVIVEVSLNSYEFYATSNLLTAKYKPLML